MDRVLLRKFYNDELLDELSERGVSASEVLDALDIDDEEIVDVLQDRRGCVVTFADDLFEYGPSTACKVKSLAEMRAMPGLSFPRDPAWVAAQCA
jgi:hypothetical protein